MALVTESAAQRRSFLRRRTLSADDGWLKASCTSPPTPDKVEDSIPGDVGTFPGVSDIDCDLIVIGPANDCDWLTWDRVLPFSVDRGEVGLVWKKVNIFKMEKINRLSMFFVENKQAINISINNWTQPLTAIQYKEFNLTYDIYYGLCFQRIWAMVLIFCQLIGKWLPTWICFTKDLYSQILDTLSSVDK